MNLKHALTHVINKKFWAELAIITFCMFISGAAVYYFLVPSNLIVGHITGLSMVLCHISEHLFGVPLSLAVIVTILNIFLLILAYIFIGKEFGAKTVYAALITGPILDFFDRVLPYQQFIAEGSAVQSIMGDPWLDLLVYTLILSASQAMLFKINASTGGLDIVGKILNKYLHLDIGTSIAVAGGLICCTAFAINPFNMVVLGLIGTWINGVAIDYFTDGLNKKKRVCIISPDYRYLQEYILNDLHRGCTLNEVIGGYSNEKKIELQVLLTNEEFSKVMNMINTEHLDAFITANTITEVYGIWNKKKHVEKLQM